MNKKGYEPSSDKSGSGTQTETEMTKKQDSKKDPYNYPVQMITN